MEKLEHTTTSNIQVNGLPYGSCDSSWAFFPKWLKIIRLKRLKTNPFYSKTHGNFQQYLHIVSHLSSSSVVSLFPYPTFLPSWMLHPQILSSREKLSNPRQNIYEGQLCFSLWMQQKPSYRAVFADCWVPVGADGSWSVPPHIFKKEQVWHTKTSYCTFDDAWNTSVHPPSFCLTERQGVSALFHIVN